MSVEFFIAKRILPNRSQGIKVSRPILTIAMISISLSIVVNLLTLAIVNGFQNEISRKVTGFSAPFFVQNANNSDFYEADPIHSMPFVEEALKANDQVLNINRVAYKPGLLQGAGTNNDVVGLVFKGIDNQYDYTFLKAHLIQGVLPYYGKSTPSDEIVLSERICTLLGYTLNDEVSAFFVNNSPITRKLKVVGIYNTGFEDYDNKLVLCDIRLTQKLNDWGISGQIELMDSTINNCLVVNTKIQGQQTQLVWYDWGKGLDTYTGQLISPTVKDTTLRVTIYSKPSISEGKLEQVDKHEIKIHYVETIDISPENSAQYTKPFKEAIEGNNLKYKFFYPINQRQAKVFLVEEKSGLGTSTQFISGYEIHLKNWNNDFNDTRRQLSKDIKLIPNDYGDVVKVVSIVDLEQNLFNWLGFLDINVTIILSLMIIIGIINMGSALLVLIIIRSNFIGLMKAMGCSNWTLQKIFLIQAGYLIGRGMLIGNAVGLLIYAVQSYTGIFTLNPEVYYLDRVPMELNPLHFILLNVGSFAVCMLALLIPSAIISRVNPIKTIKFN